MKIKYSDKKRNKQTGARIGLIFIIFIIIFLIMAFGVKKKTYIKSQLNKYPIVYKVVQRSENYLSDLWSKKIKPQKVKIKPKTVEITVDASQVIERYEKFWGGFGQDFFYSGVTLSRNKALFNLIKELNQKRPAFTFYRAHNMFSDRDAPNGEKSGGKVYQEDDLGNVSYNWERIDRFFDTIVGVGMKPIVELGFMPEALTSDRKKLGDWHAANVAPPRDYNKWKNLIKETVRHLQARYGAQEIESWYFEVWNEPDLWFHFWIPDPVNKDKANVREYLKLYDYAVAGALEVNPNIKIGGPAIAGWPYFLEDFLRHGVKDKNHVTDGKGVRIDFYSFHKYGKIEDNLLKYTKLYVDLALMIDRDRFSRTPFLIDEIGPIGTRFRKSWKNTPYVAAWMCKVVDGMFDLGARKGTAYRPAALVFWGTVGESYNGDGGVLAVSFKKDTRSIVKGPLFNVYDALSYLGNERLKLSGADFGDYVRGIATRHGNEQFEVLLYHLDDRLRSESRGKDTVSVELKINNISSGKYFFKQFKIDGSHSNAYAVWKKMGRPGKPTWQQIEILQKNDDLNPIEPVAQIEITGQELSQFKVALEANSVYLLVLNKVTDKIPPLRPDRILRKKILTHSIELVWQPSSRASDGDRADHYVIYRNGALLCRTYDTKLIDENLLDDTEYSYAIYAVDEQGNFCKSPLTVKLTTRRDRLAPKIVSFVTNSPTSCQIYFNKPLNLDVLKDRANYSINNGIEIKSIRIDRNGQRVLLTTTPHVRGRKYILTIKNLQDRAKKPNIISPYRWNYTFLPMFADSFDENSCDRYLWEGTNTEDLMSIYHFDEMKKRMEVRTGDNIRHQFSHLLPKGEKGVFRINFFPMRKYPEGGVVTIKLKADERNYYIVENSCGYGPGKLEKYVNGQLVEQKKFRREYRQNVDYFIQIKFSPTSTVCNGFGQTIRIGNNHDRIVVRKFEITLSQQDAFFDNIFYEIE